MSIGHLMRLPCGCHPSRLKQVLSKAFCISSHFLLYFCTLYIHCMYSDRDVVLCYFLALSISTKASDLMMDKMRYVNFFACFKSE